MPPRVAGAKIIITRLSHHFVSVPAGLWVVSIILRAVLVQDKKTDSGVPALRLGHFKCTLLRKLNVERSIKHFM